MGRLGPALDALLARITHLTEEVQAKPLVPQDILYEKIVECSPSAQEEVEKHLLAQCQRISEQLNISASVTVVDGFDDPASYITNVRQPPGSCLPADFLSVLAEEEDRDYAVLAGKGTVRSRVYTLVVEEDATMESTAPVRETTDSAPTFAVEVPSSEDADPEPGGDAVRRESVRIAILGERGVGKTSLVTHLLDEDSLVPLVYTPTGGDGEVHEKAIRVRDVVYPLEIIDTPGGSPSEQEDHIRGADAFVLAYSMTDRPSFDILEEVHDYVLRVKGDWAPMVLVACKADVPARYQVTDQMGLDLAEELRVPFIKSSAKCGVNVGQVFSELVHIVEHRDQGGTHVFIEDASSYMTNTSGSYSGSRTSESRSSRSRSRSGSESSKSRSKSRSRSRSKSRSRSRSKSRSKSGSWSEVAEEIMEASTSRSDDVKNDGAGTNTVRDYADDFDSS